MMLVKYLLTPARPFASAKVKGQGLMKLKNYLLRALLGCAFVVPVLVTKMSPAGFSTQDVRTHVRIDDVDYGSFDQIEGLELLEEGNTEGGDEPTFTKVTLKRDFVTDPSLYLWAK